MDRYERLERIDYKSARDVVTEADHLSEELIIESRCGRTTRPTRSSPRRAASIARSRARLHLGRVGVGHRPARRDGELRERDPVLLRVDRARRRWATDGRRRPRPDPRRDVRRDGRWSGHAHVDARHRGFAIQASDKKVDRLRVSMALVAGRSRRADRNVRKAIRIPRSMGSAALAVICREWPLRRLHPAGRPVRVGHRGRRA